MPVRTRPNIPTAAASGVIGALFGSKDSGQPDQLVQQGEHPWQLSPPRQGPDASAFSCAALPEHVRAHLERTKKAGIARVLTGYFKTVQQINGLEPAMQALTDEELRHKTAEFKQRLAGG